MDWCLDCLICMYDDNLSSVDFFVVFEKVGFLCLYIFFSPAFFIDVEAVVPFFVYMHFHGSAALHKSKFRRVPQFPDNMHSEKRIFCGIPFLFCRIL